MGRTRKMTENIDLSGISLSSKDYEEPYDWKVGPCAGMTWLQWAKEQIGEEWVEEDLPNEETSLDTSNDNQLDGDAGTTKSLCINKPV